MADLAEIGSLSSKNKILNICCVIDVFTKYSWVKPLRDKKGKKVLKAVIEIVNESNRKPNKLWVDQGRELYNKLMEEWLYYNDILMYCKHNEGQSVIEERFIKTLKAKIYKNITAKETKPYLPYLDKLVRQYNNTYHHSINKKSINVDYSALNQIIETNPKAPKFKVNVIARITKYKNIFSKGYTENWSRERFIINFVFKTNPWPYKTKDLNGEKIIGCFMKKNCCRVYYK